MVLNLDVLREAVHQLGESVNDLDRQLLQGGDFEPELLAEVLLLTRKLRGKVQKATEAVRGAGAPPHRLATTAARAGGRREPMGAARKPAPKAPGTARRGRQAPMRGGRGR